MASTVYNRLKLERDRDVKVTKLTKEDDIEAYLTSFKCLMKAYELRKNGGTRATPTACWQGTTTGCYAAMNSKEAKD